MVDEEDKYGQFDFMSRHILPGIPELEDLGKLKLIKKFRQNVIFPDIPGLDDITEIGKGELISKFLKRQRLPKTVEEANKTTFVLKGFLYGSNVIKVFAKSNLGNNLIKTIPIMVKGRPTPIVSQLRRVKVNG